MKRFLSLLIAIAMLVSTLIIVSIPTGAVDGDWMVYARKEQYREDYEDGDYVSVMGYNYDNEGFHTISPDFAKGQSPRGGLQTKSAYDLKEGIYMLVRVDAFPYSSGDDWLNLNLWSEPMVEFASTDMERDGYGVQTIMRPNNDGTDFIQLEWYKEGFTASGVSGELQGLDMYDEEGRALFELVVTYDGTTFGLTINGVSAPKSIIDYMNETFVAEEAHVGLGFYHNVTGDNGNGETAFTVLKFGTSKDNAVAPSGDDHAEPINYSLDIAPVADPSTVEEGKPAILINGSKDASDSYTTAGSSATGNSVLNPDNSVTYTASSSELHLVFKPKNEVSYAIEDFPVIMMLVRNWCTCREEDGECYACETVNMYLATGENSGVDSDHFSEIFTCDNVIEVDGDSYLYFYIDMQGEWAFDASGRVNMVRMDFTDIDYTTPGFNQFDVCFVGWFRNMEDAEGYVYDYLGINPDEETTEEETTVADDETTVAGDETTVAGDETTVAGDETTVAGDETTAPQGGSTEAPAKKGCGSVVGFGAIAVSVIVGTVGFVSLKKKED